MARTIAILTMAMTGLATTYAGSLGINPGDYLNPDGTVSIGLMPNLGTPLNSGLTTISPAFTNPDGITGTLGATGGGGFAQRNYMNSTAVLNGATIGASTTPTTFTGLAQTNVTCTTNCQGGVSTGPPYTPGTAKIYAPASAPEFNLLGDGSVADKASTSNFWYSLSTGTGTTSSCGTHCESTITIPVGIFGVSSVSSMLNTVAGLTTGGSIGGNPAAYSEITFEFQDSADYANSNSSGIVYETLALINGVTQENILDGYGGYANSLCTSSNTANTACSYTATDLGTAAGSTYKVNVGTEWNGLVATPGTNNITVGTEMVLDYQTFAINPLYQNDVLVNVSVSDTGTAATSHEVLSGLTVALAPTATPEPSTIVMLLAGFGAIAMARLRRKLS